MYSSAQNFSNLVEAAKNNDLSAVQDLMWACNPKDRNSLPFITAAQHGSLECLEALKSVSDTSANKAEALMKASSFGHLECVKFLWNRSIPKLENRGFLALCLAARQGHLPVVSYILKQQDVDPTFKFSMPLQQAALNAHVAVVELLYPVSNPTEALIMLKTQNASHRQKWQWFEDLCAAQKQKAAIEQELDPIQSVSDSSLGRKI